MPNYPRKLLVDAGPSETVLIYATSNRRHLMPEFMRENLDYQHQGEVIHASETSEEKISLSDRFGLWVSYYAFDQDDYLDIVGHWLAEFGCRQTDASHADALRWALTRGSRSGRVAWKFPRDWAGRHGTGVCGNDWIRVCGSYRCANLAWLPGIGRTFCGVRWHSLATVSRCSAPLGVMNKTSLKQECKSLG